MVAVENRNRETLTALIKEWVLPGTTIISDHWKAYDHLGEEGYEHLKVNHSVNFVDPTTGAHTNAIESTWRHAKRFMPHYCRKKKLYPGYLCHYMFLKFCKSQKIDPLQKFFEIVSEINFDPDESEVSDSEVESTSDEE